MPNIFDNLDERICIYCKQDKSQHAATCMYGSGVDQRMSYDSPSQTLLSKWKDEAAETPPPSFSNMRHRGTGDCICFADSSNLILNKSLAQ